MAKTKITPVKVTKGKAKPVLAKVKPASAIKTKVKAKVAPVVAPIVKAKVKAPKVTSVASMTLSELKARRIEIAEQIIASGVHWIEENGQLVSVLDQTDYWKIKDLVEGKK